MDRPAPDGLHHHVPDALQAQGTLDRGPVELELAVAEAFRPLETEQPFLDPEDEDVVRLLGSLSWRYGRRHWVELFALAHRDRWDGCPGGADCRVLARSEPG